MSACGRAPSPTDLPTGTGLPPGLIGTRVTKHVVGIVDDRAPDGWSNAHVSDFLTVEPRPGGRLWIGVELVQSNAHECWVEGLADYVGGAIVYRSDDPANAVGDGNGDPDAPCELHIVIDQGSGLTLSVPAQAQQGCRWFCGARASLDGAVFPWRTTPGAHLPTVP